MRYAPRVRAILLLLIVPSVCAADATPPAPKPPETAAKPSVLEEAKRHYRNGQRLYDVGRYDEAATEFQAAYLLMPDPVLLYNIGQAYRLGGRPADALRSFRRFLALRPMTPNRADVEQKIADLEARLRSARDGGAPPASPAR